MKLFPSENLEKTLPSIYTPQGWVNALIEKPRKYLVIENISPGTPVFDKKGIWVGVAVYKMERGRPSALITLPSNDILEIANQVRTRTQ